MVRWLAQEARCPCVESTLPVVVEAWRQGAGDAGGLEQAVQALVGGGCPYQGAPVALALCDAARRGDLPLLRYLHKELGVVLGPETLAAAAWGGCEAALEWLVEAGCEAERMEDCHPDCDPYLAAGHRGDVAALECLCRLGVPLHAKLLRRAWRGYIPLPVLRWLVEQGAPWDEEAVREAVQSARRQGRFGALWRGLKTSWQRGSEQLPRLIISGVLRWLPVVRHTWLDPGPQGAEMTRFFGI